MKRMFILLPLALGALPAAAQTAPSAAQQRLACMGDALRLCPTQIPDRDRIISCMATQRAALSAGCRPVFDASYRALVARGRQQKP